MSCLDCFAFLSPSLLKLMTSLAAGVPRPAYVEYILLCIQDLDLAAGRSDDLPLINLSLQGVHRDDVNLLPPATGLASRM